MDIKQQLANVNALIQANSDKLDNLRHQKSVLELDRRSSDIDTVRQVSSKIRDIDYEITDYKRVALSLEAKRDSFLRQLSNYAEQQQINDWNNARVREFELVKMYNKLCDQAVNVLESLLMLPNVPRPESDRAIKSFCSRVQLVGDPNAYYHKLRHDLPDAVCKIRTFFTEDDYINIIEGLADA